MSVLDTLVAPLFRRQFNQLGRFIGDLHLRLDNRDREIDRAIGALLEGIRESAERLARLEARASGTDGTFFRPRLSKQGRALMAVPVGDATVVVDPTEEEFGRLIATNGGWEPTIAAVILEAVRPGDTFVDIGANVGVMALQVAARVGPGGRVLAFEPNPDNLECLLRGVAATDLRNVTIYPFGLSDRRAVFSLVGGSNTHLLPAGAEGRRALTLPGDDILADESRIDFIKIDVEGHEPLALAGLNRTLRRHAPRLLCEFNPRCLRDHLGRDPAAFAAQIFGLTSRVDVVEHDGRREPVERPDDLLAFWEARNRQAVAAGFLPDGMLHFDLLFRVEPGRVGPDQ